MAKRSDEKLTKYIDSTTIVTADVANSIFGGLYGSKEGRSLDSDDPRLIGHVHDGKHADGHAQKIDLQNHVTSKLKNINLADEAVHKHNVLSSTTESHGIPWYHTVNGVKKYYLNLSAGLPAFGNNGNVQFNNSGSLAGEDDFFYDNTNNRVGIKTKTPDVGLHVYNDKIRIGDQGTFSGSATTSVVGRARLEMIANEEGSNVQMLVDARDSGGTARGQIGTVTNHDVSFFANNDMKMTLRADGKLGIGTHSPDKQLEINSSDGNNLRLTYNDNNGSASNYADFIMSSGGDLTINASGGDITLDDNVIVSGSLTVSGTTTTVNTTNTTIKDSLVELGTGTTGSASNDSGLVIERGSDTNVFMGWDESEDLFAFGSGSFTGASTGNLTISGYSNLKANDITAIGDLILDDGGSLKEAGGVAALTFDGSGHVTKIGQDSPSTGQALVWDGAKAVWSDVGGLNNIVEDTTPQLGGNLDVNGQDIVSTSNGDINIIPNGSGDVTLQADTVQLGGSGEDVRLTTNGTGNLKLDTNGGTNSGEITIYDGANGDIEVAPNGTGVIKLEASFLRVGKTGGSVAFITDGDTSGQGIEIKSQNSSGGSEIMIGHGSSSPVDIKTSGGGLIGLYSKSSTNVATLAFFDNDSVDSTGNYVGLKSPATVSTNVTFTLPSSDGTADQILKTNGSGVLSFVDCCVQDVVADNTPQLGGPLDVNGQSIVSTSNGDINIAPNGNGDVNLQADTVQVGDSNSNATVTTNGTGDLTLNTNNGTNSGFIKITDGSNGNIDVSPNGSGSVILSSGTGSNVGIGTFSQFSPADPQTRLHMVGEAVNSAQLRMDQHVTNLDGPDIRFYSSRGTASNPTVRNTNDFVGAYNVLYYDGSGYAAAGFMGWMVGDNPSQGESTFNLKTNVDGNSRARISVDGSGKIKFGNSTDGEFTFPLSDGTANQVLQTDGSGNLSFATTGTGDVTVGGTQTLTNKTLTAPKFADGGFIADSNGNEMLLFNTADNAVNYIKVNNAATGSVPFLEAEGTDNNIDIRLMAKGTGTVGFVTNGNRGIDFDFDGASSGVVTTFESSATTNRTITFPNATGTLALTSDITAISGGTGVDVSGTGVVTLDLNELTSSSADSIGDWFVVVSDTGNGYKLDKDDINISGFNNDAGFTNNSGTVTSVELGADSGTGTAITGSGAFTIAGGTNVTTSVSGTTVTVNSTASGSSNLSITSVNLSEQTTTYTATQSDANNRVYLVKNSGGTNNRVNMQNSANWALGQRFYIKNEASTGFTIGVSNNQYKLNGVANGTFSLAGFNGVEVLVNVAGSDVEFIFLSKFS